jgi:hypothetical protein
LRPLASAFHVACIHDAGDLHDGKLISLPPEEIGQERVLLRLGKRAAVWARSEQET